MSISSSSYIIMLLILTWNNQKEKDVDYYGSNKLIIKNLLGLQKDSPKQELSLTHFVWILPPPLCGLLHHLRVGFSTTMWAFLHHFVWIFSTRSSCGHFTIFLKIPKSKSQSQLHINHPPSHISLNCRLSCLLALVRATPVKKLNHQIQQGSGSASD